MKQIYPSGPPRFPGDVPTFATRYACQAIPDSARCDDHDDCTQDSCQASGCVHAAASLCDDGMSCTSDVCSASECSHERRASCAEADDPFGTGTMYFGGPALGRKPLHVALMGYSGQHESMTLDAAREMLFGTSYPNLREQFLTSSHGAFTWTEGKTVGWLKPEDDPETFYREDLVDDFWPGEPGDPYFVAGSGRFLYTSLRFKGVRDPGTGLDVTLRANNAGGGTTEATNSNLDDWESFRVVEVSRKDGTLCSSDRLAFKTGSGHYLRDVDGQLSATGTSISDASTHFFARIVQKAEGNENTCVEDGDTIALSSVARADRAGRFVKRTAGGAIRTDGSTGSPLIIGRTHRSMAQLDRDLYSAMVRAGVNFADFDADGNGTVETDEFHLLVIEPNRTADLKAVWGQSRNPAAGFRPASSTVAINLFHSFVGESGPVLNLTAHELGHQLGADHYYGTQGGNQTLSVMGSSGELVQSFDAYHKMRLGWTMPRVVWPGSGGTEVLETMEARGSVELSKGKRPLLFVDATHFNRTTQRGEYFMLEYRNALDSESYDAALNTPGNRAPAGVALWHVEVRADGSVGLEHLAAPTTEWPAFTRGNWELWTADNGWVYPKFLDGAPAPFAFHVMDAGDGEQVRVQWHR
ncbi:MAG TPA: hypothetical protein VFX59_07890 [Polyangiales bacterium]|nr:hypothetical protein [Polyangiales bacterium]